MDLIVSLYYQVTDNIALVSKAVRVAVQLSEDVDPLWWVPTAQVMSGCVHPGMFIVQVKEITAKEQREMQMLFSHSAQKHQPILSDWNGGADTWE